MVQTTNAIQEKSFNFALDIIELYKELNNQKEYVLSKQLLRAGTSIGANVEEALQGQSKKDFISKLCISLKEAYETQYWLKLLDKSNLTQQSNINLYLSKIIELIKLLTAIIKTSKNI
jgi:four helix bundle protein